MKKIWTVASLRDVRLYGSEGMLCGMVWWIRVGRGHIG